MSSDHAWRRWGETDPYFGVLTNARFRKDVIADHRDAFWSSGQAYVAERMATAEHHFGPFLKDRALDFGCGVGRLSLPMAQQFNAVVGLDISPAMMNEARRCATEAGISNLDVRLSDDQLSAADGKFDLVMSCMVLQHIPARRGMLLIRGLLERTRQYGVIALHVCTDRSDTLPSAFRYWAQCSVPGAHWLTNLARRRPSTEPLMQMNAYPLHHILQLSRSLGFGHALVTMDGHGRFQTAQLLMRRMQDIGV
jgi:SAM-dependent methyltransferase